LPMLPALRYFMQDGAHASYFYGDGMWNALSCGDHTFSVRHAWGRPVTACTVRPYFIWTRAFPALDIAMQQDTPVYCAASRSGHEVHLGQPYVGWLLRSIVPAKDRCAPPLAAAYRLLAETKTAPLQDMAETLTQMDAHTPIRLELYGSKLTVSSAEHARTFKIAEEVHERYRWIVSSSALALSLLSARANASLRLFTDAKATELMLDQGDASPVWALASYREEPVETVRLLPAPLRRQVAHILGG